MMRLPPFGAVGGGESGRIVGGGASGVNPAARGKEVKSSGRRAGATDGFGGGDAQLAALGRAAAGGLRCRCRARSAVSSRNRRSSEYSRKSPRSSRDTSGWDRPSSRAASVWVMPRSRTMSSMRLTNSALTRWASASGKPRSAKTLPLPRSTALSLDFMASVSMVGFTIMLLGGAQAAPDPGRAPASESRCPAGPSSGRRAGHRPRPRSEPCRRPGRCRRRGARQSPARRAPKPLQRLGVAMMASELGAVDRKPHAVLHGIRKASQIRLARADPFDRFQHVIASFAL